METKILEIRDSATFIAVLCVNMQPSGEAGSASQRARHYYLRRCGFPCDGRPNIGMTTLSADGNGFRNDPHGWGGRTRPAAHKYIIEHWNDLKDGDVVDVQFILGETDIPKISERLSNTVDSGARR
jgi:hypothetical protein